MNRIEVVLSDAITIQPGDKLINVRLPLVITVNVSAYNREYGEGDRITDIRDYIANVVTDYLGSGEMLPEGILTDLVLDR